MKNFYQGKKKTSVDPLAQFSTNEQRGIGLVNCNSRKFSENCFFSFTF